MERSLEAIRPSSAEVHKVTGVTFGILRPNEIEAMSVCEVKHSGTYDERGTPRDGGINDLHMGTNDRALLCKTCNGNKKAELLLLWLMLISCKRPLPPQMSRQMKPYSSD